MPIPFILIGIAAATGIAGLGSGAAGAKNMHTAGQIIKDAQYKYDREREVLDKLEKESTDELENLGRFKLGIWESFERFTNVYEKIKNKPVFEKYNNNDKLVFSKQELNEIEGISITALNLLGTTAISAGSGALVGLAAYGGTMTFGVASTGTAIGTLSGVAATNATLAALGGGALSIGGLGMAGGTLVLGGMVAGPILAVSGVLLAIKGSSSKQKALEAKAEVNKAIILMNEAMPLLRDLNRVSTQMYGELKILFDLYIKKIIILENVVEKNSDYNYFSDEDKKLLQATVLLVKMLKEMTTVDILVKNNEKQTVNVEIVEKIIDKSKITRYELNKAA